MGQKPIKQYKAAKDRGKVLEKDGYHQCKNCYCKLETRKGAYRDVTIELEGNKYHFYHQNLVVKELSDKYVLNSCGHKTKTTKERINRYIPSGYKVIQEDFTWYLVLPNGKRQNFKDNMKILKGGK